MSDNKKYYYMRLKENFFDSDNMLLLESMPDGYLYSNILLKLYLRSLKDDGRLMLNGRIPYNPQMLATVTRHQIGTVERAINIFKDLGLIEILDNGAIYMMDIQNYIGESSSEGDRKRLQRKRVENEKKALESGQMSSKCLDKYPPELELELEIDIDKEIDITTTTGDDVELSTDSFNLSTFLTSLHGAMSRHWKRTPTDTDVDYALPLMKKLNNDFDMLSLAMEVASQYGERACNWNYTASIVNSWVQKGYSTEEDVLLHELGRKSDAYLKHLNRS